MTIQRDALGRSVMIPFMAVIVLILTACGGAGQDSGANNDATSADSQETPTSQENGEALRIGVVGALSGPAATFGQSVVVGAQAAVRDMEEEGWPGGREIELVIRDDEADPTASLGLVKELLEEENVDGLIASATSGTTSVILPEIAAAGVPHVLASSSGTTLDASANPYSFKAISTDSQSAKTGVDFLVEELGVSSPAIFGRSDAFGEFMREYFEAALEEHGISASTVQSFEPGTTDLTSQMINIRDSGADAILAGSYPGGLAATADAQERLGMNLPIIDSGSLATAGFFDLVGGDPSEGTYSVTIESLLVESTEADHSPEVQKVIDAVLANDDDFTYAWANVGAAYDSMLLFASAIEATGGLNPDEFKSHLESNVVEGVFASYEYSESDHNGLREQGVVDIGAMTSSDLDNAKLVRAG